MSRKRIRGSISVDVDIDDVLNDIDDDDILAEARNRDLIPEEGDAPDPPPYEEWVDELRAAAKAQDWLHFEVLLTRYQPQAKHLPEKAFKHSEAA